MEFDEQAIMEQTKINSPAIRELAAILEARGISYQTGLVWAVHTCRQTQSLVDWLKENPNAEMEEIGEKVRELGRL